MPEDVDINRLYETTDAMVWAEAFVRTVQENPSIATDPGTMVGWFANAMMTQHDHDVAEFKDTGHRKQATLAPDPLAWLA